MSRKSQTVLWGIWIAVFVLLVCVLIRYCKDNHAEPVENSEDRQLVLMVTYETEPYRKALTWFAEEYSGQSGNPRVVIDFVAQSDFQKELCIDKDQDRLPDLIICENVMTPALVSMGILRDLSDYMTNERTVFFNTTAYNSTVVNGSCYGIPLTCDPYVLYYNEDYLLKHGGVMPKKMEEFYEWTRTARTQGVYNLGIALKNKEDATACLTQFIYSYGGTIRDLNGAHCMDLYEMLAGMRDDGIVSQDMINWNQSDLMYYFADGMVSVVMARMSSSALLNAEHMDFTYRVTEIPYAQRPAYLMHGENIGITVDADEKEALQFAEYMTSKDTMERYDRMVHCLSVRSDLSVNPLEAQGLEDAFIQKQRERGLLKSSYSSWFLISGAFGEEINRFFGDSSIDANRLSEDIQDAVRVAIMER
ncbi:MAG: extracellular solute-binding protein [bacterium]|nr:extracellular solute-binding protein [bacterium]